MKRAITLLTAIMLIACCSMGTALAAESGTSLDDIVNAQEQPVEGQTQPAENNGSTSTQNQESTTTGGLSQEQQDKNNEFIAGLQEATDLTDPVEGVNAATPWIKQAAGFVVQVVFYAVTVLLAVRVVLDLAYIGLPFTRSFLGNGYSGAAAAQGQPGMGGPGMGMGGPGMGMGGYGMNRMGMGGMGGYGMNRMGMGGYGAGGNPNQTGQMMGKIQWVSNAALIAAEQEGQMTPDGKHTGPLKSYMKNMIVVLVLVPVLLVLAATGALTQLGLTIGEILVDTIAMVGDMI